MSWFKGFFSFEKNLGTPQEVRELPITIITNFEPAEVWYQGLALEDIRAGSAIEYNPSNGHIRIRQK